ncbi:glycosyltransferase family 39 protein [Paenibacillus sp.]|uniref:glycosyltransferase family 39 protein n=1 Tax=Paenibacillus sp. TaxID=58172 RepID=UPI0028A6DBC0|nr:glycosyltransferase family 39 protein [Paenibacillus sp.]
MSNLIYNDVIATAFLTSALYFAVKFIKRRSMKDILFAATLLAVGNYFRSIGIIFLITMVFSLLFNIRAIGVKKALGALFITALLFNVPGWTQNAVLQSTNVVDEPINTNSAPVYMWLNMGVNLETFGFWDNWQSYTIYQQDANYNKAESTKLFKVEISNKLSEASLRGGSKMRTKRFLALIIAVLSCSMVLVSCEAITAQKILSTYSGSRANGGQGFTDGRAKDGGGSPGMNGGTRRNGSQGTDGGSGQSGR